MKQYVDAELEVVCFNNVIRTAENCPWVLIPCPTHVCANPVDGDIVSFGCVPNYQSPCDDELELEPDFDF